MKALILNGALANAPRAARATASATHKLEAYDGNERPGYPTLGFPGEKMEG